MKKHSEEEQKFSLMLWLGENIDTPYGRGTILSLNDKTFDVLLDRQGIKQTITYKRIDEFTEKLWREKAKKAQ